MLENGWFNGSKAFPLSDLSVLQCPFKCVVPENIHTPPMEGFSNNLNPPPLQKFPFGLILSLKKIGF